MMTGCGAPESMCKVQISFEKDPFPSFELSSFFIHATLLSPHPNINLSRLDPTNTAPLL